MENKFKIRKEIIKSYRESGRENEIQDVLLKLKKESEVNKNVIPTINKISFKLILHLVKYYITHLLFWQILFIFNKTI